MTIYYEKDGKYIMDHNVYSIKRNTYLLENS